VVLSYNEKRLLIIIRARQVLDGRNPLRSLISSGVATSMKTWLHFFVLAWSVDRLGRSLQDLVAFLSELHALRIDLFLHQQGLDTTTPAGKALFQMMGVFAEFERAMIQERVRAGLARARDEGTRLGRPPIPTELEERIRAALDKPGRTEGVRKIAARFGVNPKTVQRISRPFVASAA
jgi:DNA invertase Pin-like site-specific DNA recombinase